MRNILVITSSLMGERSKSSQVATELVTTLRRVGVTGSVKERALTPENMPHLSLETLGALGAAADQRSVVQQSKVDFADSLIEEVENADVVVLAAPMYNFTIPTTLKAWLDHVARAGRTFRYNEKGQPIGLLKNKKVYAVISRGGYYGSDDPIGVGDFQESYLRHMLRFIGLEDVTFIHIEGQAVGDEAAAKGVALARGEVQEAVVAAAA
tara:strand:- start:630 stop:1259 length:630 start_codon:yes stop_codon:yes gene_type:complete